LGKTGRHLPTPAFSPPSRLGDVLDGRRGRAEVVEREARSGRMADRGADEHPPQRDGRASHLAVARAVYGLIIVLAVLETMELHPPGAGWEGPELLLGTVLTVVLAEVYADLIAGTFVHHKRPSRTELGLTGREAAPLLIGAPLPVLVLVL